MKISQYIRDFKTKTVAYVLPGRPRPVQPHGIDLLDFDDATAPWAYPAKGQCNDGLQSCDAHFRPDKPWGATGKSLIVLNPWLTLNHRVPGSSPGAPTKLFNGLAKP